MKYYDTTCEYIVQFQLDSTDKWFSLSNVYRIEEDAIVDMDRHALASKLNWRVVRIITLKSVVTATHRERGNNDIL